MADKNLLSQMLEHLVNEDQAKAEELFHEYVVAASREIYEGLIESELKDEEVEEAAEEDEEDKVDEAAAEDEDKDDDDLDENFEDIAVEADDEGDMGADPTDDLAGELDAGHEGEEGEAEEGEEQLFQDLEAIVDELQAKFDELKGIETDEHGDEFGAEEGEGEDMPEEAFELETVREYVEKVGTPKGGDNGANAKSIVAGKNDMGGTSANIARGGEAKGEGTEGGLAKPTTQLQDGGNVNVPGGNAGKTAFKKKETAKGGDDGDKSAAGLFRGRR
jgi:hypothetical protein